MNKYLTKLAADEIDLGAISARRNSSVRHGGPGLSRSTEAQSHLENQAAQPGFTTTRANAKIQPGPVKPVLPGELSASGGVASKPVGKPGVMSKVIGLAKKNPLATAAAGVAGVAGLGALAHHNSKVGYEQQ